MVKVTNAYLAYRFLVVFASVKYALWTKERNNVFTNKTEAKPNIIEFFRRNIMNMTKIDRSTHRFRSVFSAFAQNEYPKVDKRQIKQEQRIDQRCRKWSVDG